MVDFNKTRFVDEVNEFVMDGDDTLEKKINAYLTKRFILSKNVPADECLDEAKTLIAIVRDHDKIEAYKLETDDNGPLV